MKPLTPKLDPYTKHPKSHSHILLCLLHTKSNLRALREGSASPGFLSLEEAIQRLTFISMQLTTQLKCAGYDVEGLLSLHQ